MCKSKIFSWSYAEPWQQGLSYVYSSLNSLLKTDCISLFLLTIEQWKSYSCSGRRCNSQAIFHERVLHHGILLAQIILLDLRMGQISELEWTPNLVLEPFHRHVRWWLFHVAQTHSIHCKSRMCTSQEKSYLHDWLQRDDLLCWLHIESNVNTPIGVLK